MTSPSTPTIGLNAVNGLTPVVFMSEVLFLSTAFVVAASFPLVATLVALGLIPSNNERSGPFVSFGATVGPATVGAVPTGAPDVLTGSAMIDPPRPVFLGVSHPL